MTKDALPFAKTVGNRARIYGLNTIGLVRRGFSQDADRQAAPRLPVSAALEHQPRDRADRARSVAAHATKSSYLVDFIRSSSRGVGLRRPSRRLEEVVEE